MPQRTMQPEAILAHLRNLAITVPNLGNGRLAASPTDPVALAWLGKLTALIDQQNNSVDKAQLQIAMMDLGTMVHDKGVASIMQLLHIAIAKADLVSSPSSQGSFISVGSHFDAFSAMSDIARSATKRVLMIDPYLDTTALTKFAVSAPETIKVDLLSDAKSVKPDLKPAVAAFILQYGVSRPIEARLTASGALHDRLVIVDDTTVWDLSQSLKDFATRSPGGMTKANAELTALKLSHYIPAWRSASALV